MDSSTLSEDQSTMRECLSQQQKGILNCLLQSMSLPIAMIGNSFQLHAASYMNEPRGDYRVSAAVELTSNNKKCPAPTHPCREPPKSEKCIEKEEEDEECCEDEDDYDECEEEEEEDECCCIDEREDDCIEEEEEDCIDDEEEEDCIEEEEEDCVEEEEEEDCIEEEEEDCIEEEEEDCIEEEEEEDCIEEEEEEPCVEEEKEIPKPKCPSPSKKSTEKETQTSEKFTEKIFNGKRQICLEAPPECIDEKTETKKETEGKQNTKSEARCKKNYKQHIDCDSRNKIDDKCKREPKISADNREKETRCKKKPMKDSDCSKEPKKKTECKKDIKKNMCCDGDFYEKETHRKKGSMKDECCDGDFYEKETRRKKGSMKDECCDGDFYEKETRRKKGPMKDKCCDGDFYEKETRCKKGSMKDKCCHEDFYEKETRRKKGSRKDECCEGDFYEKETRRKKGSRKDECCEGDFYEKETRRKKGSRKDECCNEDYEKKTCHKKVSTENNCYNKENGRKMSRRKVSKKDECFDEDFDKETNIVEEPKKKRKCSKDRDSGCDEKAKKETNCKQECKKETTSNADSKKQSDCYAEEELKKICRKYRNYDCIPPWLEDTKKSRRPNNCSPSKKGGQDDREQQKCYEKHFTRDCCNQRDSLEEEEESEVEEGCMEEEEDGPEYHPEKGCSTCEHFISKKEERHQPNKGKASDQNYYFNNEFGERNLKTWEKCSGDAADMIRNIAKNKSKEYIYNQFEAKKRSLYTENNCYMHSPKFETLEGGSIKNEYRLRRNTLGTYTCPNVNNNYNGYVVQNDDVYTSQELYTANEEPHYTREVAEAETNVPFTYSSGASNYDYSVKNCSFSQICYNDAPRRLRNDSASGEDDDEDTALSEAIEKDGVYRGSCCSDRDNSVRSLSTCEDDSHLDEVSEKYRHYGQANAGDDDDYYTTHSKGSNYCNDDGKLGLDVASHSLDSQVYTTRIQCPVEKLARRKSPAPSMFDVEHLIVDSMSEASNDSCVDSENEAKYKVMNRDGDDRSFTSSFSHFTNSPLENLKRVIATIKKRALGIEDDITGNMVETVHAEEIDVNSVYKARKQTCDNEHSDRTRFSANDLKRKKTPQFLVPPERKPKPMVQLINQTVSRHPFQSKCEVVECNNGNRPPKSHFLVSKSTRTQKACRSNANQDVINHIAKVLAQPEHHDAEIENVPTVCKNASSDQISQILCVDNKDMFSEKTSQPLSLQSLNYVDKRVAKRHAYTERPPSRTQSYSTTPSTGRSAHFQKPNTEKQKSKGKKTKTVIESSTRARSPSRAKSYVKGNGFQFRQLASKKEDLDKKGKFSEKESKKLEFIHVPESVAKSLPFFKSEDTSKDLLDRTSVEMPTILLDTLADESKTKHKSGPRVFKSLSKENGESTKSVAKFMNTKAERTPLKSANSQHKKVDISGDMPTSSFPWRSPHVITKGPIHNGQNLYNYRKSQKRQKENQNDPVDSAPEVISPASSIGEDLDEFHDRILSMEMCDSAKMIRKKIRQVNYMPDRTIFEASESSNSDDNDDDDDEDEISSKSSVDEHSSSDAWYCDVPVNIVRTQELYRNQKKTNSIMDEIISLTKQRGVSDDIAQYLAEEEQALENSDYFEDNTEGRSLLEASHCDQSNTSPTIINVDSEDYNTSPYNKVYTQKVQDDTEGKQAVQDSETFLSFNKSMIHHIGRILCNKGKDEEDDEEGIIPECESPFEVSGNEEINCNLNSLQGGDDPADSESNAQKSNSAGSLFQPNPSPNKTSVETQLRKCAFKLDSPKASKISELENKSQTKSSPPLVFPNKLPFQSPANAFLIATNKLARSKSELYLSMKEQERTASTNIKESTRIVQKNNSFKSKPDAKKERRGTAPLSINEDYKANKPVRFEKSSPKRNGIWLKLSREKLVDSKSKASLDKSEGHKKTNAEIEAMQAKTGPRNSSHSLIPRARSPGDSVSTEKLFRNEETQANTSKSLPHVFSQNKLTGTRSKSQMSTKDNSPVTDIQNVKASPSPRAGVEGKSVTTSRSQSSVLSSKIPATVLTPSIPKNEPKRSKAAREMQSKKDSPGLRRKKNKIKSIVDKMEQKKVSHEDHFKLITNRSQESLRSKSGTEMLMKKLEKFKQLVDAKKFKEAIPGKGAVVAVIATETESHLREKSKAERRQKYERPDEWKNKGKTTRATEGKEDARNPDVINDAKTMSTQTPDTPMPNETNSGEGDVKKLNETKKISDGQKKVKIGLMERKIVDKTLLSSKSKESKKEEEKNPVVETKEELNIPNTNTANETKAEEPTSYAERRLQELRKKYQRSIGDKKTTPESSFEHIKSTTSSSLEKPEVNTEEPWKIRMRELKKVKMGALEEKRALAKVNAEELKPVELTSLAETTAPVVEETVPKSLPERRVQEWRQKYQPSLVKRFSKTDITKEETNKKSQGKVKGQMTILTKGRKYSLEARRARLLASDSDLSMEQAKPLIVRRHFRSLAKTDIFGIPQAAGKHPSVVKQQTRALRSRSRSRSTSRTNLLSPKMKKKQQKQPDPPKKPFIPPTILEVKSEPVEKVNDAEKVTEKATEKVTEKATEKNAEKPSVDTESAQERARQSRGTTAYKIGKGSAGKPLNIKKNNLQSSKQQDVGYLTSAVEAVEDAVSSMAASMPTVAMLPSTMSDQKAALEEMKANSLANKNAAVSDDWIKPTIENEVESKDTFPKKAEPVVKKDVVRRVRRDGQTSYAIKKDFVENGELVRENVIASDLKLTRAFTPDFNYEKKYDTPSSMNQNEGMEHKANTNFMPPPPTPKPCFNNPKPDQNEEDDYLKYADFRQQISNTNRPNQRRPVYEPKLASHKFSKPLNSNRNEIYQKQAYKISNNEPAQTVRTKTSNPVVPPTVLSAPAKSVASEPEKPKPLPKTKTPSPPASAPMAQTDNLIADVSKSTFGMFTKLINTITRTSVFEENDAEKPKNKNSNAIADGEASTHYQWFLVMDKDNFILQEDEIEGCQLKRTQGEANDFNNSNSVLLGVGQICVRTDSKLFDRDGDINCNNSADGQPNPKKPKVREQRKKRGGKLSKESNDKRSMVTGSSSQDGQLDNASKIQSDGPSINASNTQENHWDNANNIKAEKLSLADSNTPDAQLDKVKNIKDEHEATQRLRKCYSSLESCSESDSASLTTLNTLIEWNFVLMCVILLLLFGTFTPGSLSDFILCPLPSLYNGLYSVFLGSAGINLLCWFQPARSSFWNVFGRNEPGPGLFYSFIYQLTVFLPRLIFFILRHILIPIVSIPFLVFGPVVNVLMNATLCTLTYMFNELQTFVLALTKGGLAASNPSTASVGQNTHEVSSCTDDEESDELLYKLQDIQQYASFFIYLGPNTAKKQCAYSVLTSFYLWLTNQTPAECM